MTPNLHHDLVAVGRHPSDSPEAHVLDALRDARNVVQGLLATVEGFTSADAVRICGLTDFEGIETRVAALDGVLAVADARAFLARLEPPTDDAAAAPGTSFVETGGGSPDA